MSGLPASPPTASHPAFEMGGAAGQTSASVRTRGNKALAAMLLAALVSALLVVADSVVDAYAEGHLLLGWVCL